MSSSDAQHGWKRIVRMLESRTPPRPLPVAGWIILVAGAVILFWVTVSTLVARYEVPLTLAFGLATLQCVTLPLAVRYPRTAMLLHVLALFLIGFLTRSTFADEFWPVPEPNLLALLVILVVLGLRESWIVAVSAWWLSFLAMTLVVALTVNAVQETEEWGTDMLISVTLSLVALGISLAIGQRKRVREVLASARRDVELEQARRATVEERARIARELHDVVAHSMSIVHIQAESARYRIADLDGARTEFDDIARSARAALGEMRQLLAALHPDDDGALYAPQPTIADIPALVQGAEKVGSTVRFHSDVAPDAASAVVQLTAYRIVQEALSNVMRHAPRADVEVSLRRGPEVIEVTVHNGASPETGGPGTLPEAGGHGLRGMRERVALLHGDIEQTPLPDGGYLISAHLPTTSREETS